MSRRRALMSIRHKRYKYVPGGYIRTAENGGRKYNNNITTADSPDGSKMFTVKVRFRIHDTSIKIILASNWSNSSNGWEVGVNKGVIYYKESYDGQNGKGSVTSSFQTIQPDIWYDLKFWAGNESHASKLYCSIDGGATYQTLSNVPRWRSESNIDRSVIFGNQDGTVDIRGLVGCIGISYGSSVINTCEFDIENATVGSWSQFASTSGDDYATIDNPGALYGYE